MNNNNVDLTKLCKLLLLTLHKITVSTRSERTKTLTEAGYLLEDLGWPCKITEELDYNKYEWDDRLDLRGFDKV